MNIIGNLITSLRIKVIDPESPFLMKWKRIMIIIGVLSMIQDPLFLYISHVKGSKCFGIDFQAGFFLAFSRTLLDLFHLFHVILKFHIPFEGIGPKVFKKKNLIKDPRLIAINYMKSTFIVDLIAILPLPQIIIWSKSTTAASGFLPSIILYMFGPRMLAMVPWHTKIVQAFGIAVKSVWSGAIYNLFIFILIGHFLGALFYQFYFDILKECLFREFKNEMHAKYPVGLDCSEVHKVCITKRKEIEQGMVSDAFANEIGTRSFIQKSIYCFVWGVRSLSSLGQTFDANFHVMETTFSCIVMMIGLILLADLIARMQTSVQSAGARREGQRIKQRKLEEWTHYHHLPPDLKGLVRQSVQTDWQTTEGIDDEGMLSSLPLDLRHDIRHHLYKERLCNVPPFSRMDDQLLDFVCGHLRTYTGAEGTYILLQGDPLEKMYFIFRGLLQLTHHRSGHANSRVVEVGDFFGEELLPWATQLNSPNQGTPLSTYTVKCISNVEAFCLPAEDIRVLPVFNYALRFQHALRKHQP